jgi:sugar lactone lactonase YvrE
LDPKIASLTELPPPVGSLFSFSKELVPTKHVPKITISNGLAWSKDQMYYIDSATKKVEAFDFDAENGKICKYPWFGNLYKNVNIQFMIV